LAFSLVPAIRVSPANAPLTSKAVSHLQSRFRYLHSQSLKSSDCISLRNATSFVKLNNVCSFQRACTNLEPPYICAWYYMGDSHDPGVSSFAQPLGAPECSVYFLVYVVVQLHFARRSSCTVGNQFPWIISPRRSGRSKCAMRCSV